MGEGMGYWGVRGLLGAQCGALEGVKSPKGLPRTLSTGSST